MIDSWLVAHAWPPGITTTLHNVEETEENGENNNNNNNSCTSGQLTQTEQDSISALQQQLPQSTQQSQPVPTGVSAATANNRAIVGSAGSKNSSGSGTPVRKISAHEFERGGLTKPLVTTVDGAHTFLSPPLPSCVESLDGRGQLIRKRSRHDIQGLNETDLILELVKDICNDLDIKRLCHKILQNVGILTNADR